MSLPSRRLAWPAALLLAWGLTTGEVVAAPVTPEKEKPSTDTPAEKLRKDLDRVVKEINLKDTLAGAIDQLAEQTRVKLVVDRSVLLMLAQIDPNQQGQTINYEAHNIKLRTALRNMLSGQNLTYVIVGDSVLITTEDMALVRQLRQPVSLDLDKTPFSAALRQLSRETGANLLLDGKVQKEAATPVSLQLDDVPLETAVRLLSEMVGLKPVRMGNVLYVTSKANANDLRNDPDLATPGQPGVLPVQRDVVVPPGVVPVNPPPQPVPPPPTEKVTETPPVEKEKPVEKDKEKPVEPPTEKK